MVFKEDLLPYRWLFDQYLSLKNEAAETIAAKAAQIESLRAAQENFENDVSILEKTIHSDKVEITLLQSQGQHQDKQSSALKSKCDVARSKCFSKLHEVESLEKQISKKMMEIFEGQASSDAALKGLMEERSTREKKLEALVQNLKIAELEANLAGNARAETLELRRALQALERKNEIAEIENEKLKIKLPKMEKMLQQKAQDFEEANDQSAAKILQLQREGSAAFILFRCKNLKHVQLNSYTFESDNFPGRKRDRARSP
jgi:hypothetical protein